VVLDGPTLGVIFQGLATLAVALGFTAANRSKRAAVDAGAFRTLQRECLAWAEHGYGLERRLAGAGLPVPRRPPLLEERYGPAYGAPGGGDGGDDSTGHGGGTPAPASA
jgi:hypothetical protein